MSSSPTYTADSAPNQGYKYLTREDVDHFLTRGWLRLPNAIQPEYLKWVEDLWVRIGYDPNDKTTWKEEYLHLPRHHEAPAELFAPDAWNKTIEICGGLDRIDPVRERYYGDAFIVNFGSEDKTGPDVPEFRPQDRQGWHTDDDWYRMFLDSSGNAMTVVHCFTDIPKRGGGTWLCPEALPHVVRYLYDNRQGFDPPMSQAHVGSVKECNDFDQVVAKKGDVFLLHGLLPHAAGPNYLHYARVISNPHVCLRDPHNFNRADGKYNLLEQVILRNLGMTSIPDFIPGRERKSWFPRNSGFKRAYAEKELERLVKHYLAQGRSADEVDSIYQKKGTKEWEEYERRNGYDQEVNPAGNLMEQHTIGSFVRTR